MNISKMNILKYIKTTLYVIIISAVECQNESNPKYFTWNGVYNLA